MKWLDDILKLFPEGNNSTLPGDFPSQAGNTSSPITQLMVSLSLGLSSLLLFSVCRLVWPGMYSSKLFLKSSTPPKLGKSLFGWVVPLYRTTEEEVFDLAGLDALMLLRFFKLGFKVFGILSLYGVFVLIPLTSSEYKAGEVFDINKVWMIDMLPSGDKRLIAHSVGVYLATFVLIYFLNKEYQVYSHLRCNFLKQSQFDITARTIRVEGFSDILMDQQKFKEYFESLDVGPIESVCLSYEVPELTKIIRTRSKILKKLESNLVVWLKNPCTAEDYDVLKVQRSLDSKEIIRIGDRPRPFLRKKFNCSQTDAINYYHQLFKKYDLEVLQLRNAFQLKSNLKARTGFVTFKVQRSAHVAAQLRINSSPLTLRIHLAPEPCDIYWENIPVSTRGRIIKTFAVSIMMVFVIFFWGIPLSFVAPLLSLTELVKVFPTLSKLEHISPLVWSLISGLLPTLLTIIFISSTPGIFTYLSIFQGEKSRSSIERLAVSKHFFFLLINVLLVFTISSTFWKQLLNRVIKHPSAIATILAKSLPTVAPFFINYVMILGIGYFPLQLLQIGPVCSLFLKRLISSTPRDFAEVFAPVVTNYAWIYGQPMLIFTIVAIYSVIAPLILVVGVVYFTLGYYANKYCLLYVHHRRYESGGLIWPMVFRRILLGLFLLLFTMSGLFALYDSLYLTYSLIPLFIITLCFILYTSRTFPSGCEFIPKNWSPDEFYNSNNSSTSECDALIQGQHNLLSNNTRYDTFHPKNYQENYGNTTFTTVKTDYQQSSMLRFDGVLDSSLNNYHHPAFFGTLPYLWLPQKIGHATLRS